MANHNPSRCHISGSEEVPLGDVIYHAVLTHRHEIAHEVWLPYCAALRYSFRWRTLMQGLSKCEAGKRTLTPETEPCRAKLLKRVAHPIVLQDGCSTPQRHAICDAETTSERV